MKKNLVKKLLCHFGFHKPDGFYYVKNESDKGMYTDCKYCKMPFYQNKEWMHRKYNKQ